MQNPLRVDEQAVLEASKLIPEGNMSLLTQQEAWNHLDSSQNTNLFFPPKGLEMSFCRSLSTENKILTVVQEASNFMSMMEVVTKVQGFLGDRSKLLQRIRRLLPDLDAVRSKDHLSAPLIWVTTPVNTSKSIGPMTLLGMTLFFRLKWYTSTL